jgi:RimJ/RimL family protein N-acetyltransferase
MDRFRNPLGALAVFDGTVIVRGARIEDVPAMVATLAAVAEEGVLGAEPPVDVEARADAFRAMIESGESAAVWVLEDDGRIVGQTVTQERARGVFSLGMAILPEARGRGGGRMLLERVVEHARSTGAHKVELEVWPDNARAVALYARAGFEIEGLRRRHYRRRDGSLRSSLIMARLLAGEEG